MTNPQISISLKPIFFVISVRRHPRCQRLPGHVDPRLGRRNWRLQARTHGPPVPDVRHGAAGQHPRLGKRRFDRQSLGYHDRAVSTDAFR